MKFLKRQLSYFNALIQFFKTRAGLIALFILGYAIQYSWYLIIHYRPGPANIMLLSVWKDGMYIIYFVAMTLFARYRKSDDENEFLGIGVLYMGFVYSWKILNDLNYFLKWQITELLVINIVTFCLLLLILKHAKKLA